MDNPIEEPRHISRRKARVDVKLSRPIRRKAGKSGITKREFFAILDKASQPIKKDKSETE